MDKICSYIFDTERFARLKKLKETMEEARDLMNETENIVNSWNTATSMGI